MRVLHTNFLRGWGGQSNRILMECRGLAERGWEVLLSVPRDSELAKRARAAGLAVDERVGYESLIRSVAHGDVKRFRTLLREFRPDIVHLHGGRDSWIAALALMGYRPRPIVVRTKHNVFPIANHPANRWMYGRFFDHIVCISSAIVAQCAEKRYIAPSRELLAVLQLFRTTQKMIFRFEIEEGALVREVEVNGKMWQMYDDTVIGFDAQGREVVRLSVVEPLHERPLERLNSI